MSESMNQTKPTSGLSKRLRKAASVTWADMSRAWPVREEPSYMARAQAQTSLVEAESLPMLLAAARLVVSRWLSEYPHCCVAFLNAPSNVAIAVPLNAPGALRVRELIADSEGWLQHGQPAAVGKPLIVVRTREEAAGTADAVTDEDPPLTIEIDIGSRPSTITVQSKLFALWRLRAVADQISSVATKFSSDDIDTQLHDVEVITSKQRRMTEQWSGMQDPALEPVDPCAALQEYAAAHPEHIAVVQGERHMSYEELNFRANGIACLLQAHGVRANDRVAICMERGVDMVVGLWAVLKSGAAYVPIDPAYPQHRLQFMLGDCLPAAVLTTAPLRERVASANAPVIVTDEQITNTGDDPACSNHQVDRLAYVIYTSGSTGQPKGAGVTHRGLANLLAWYVHQLEIGKDDRVLVATSFSFDLTQKNLLAPLCCGGQVHLCPPGFDPAGVLETLSRGSVTVANLTPSYFYALSECARGNELASLRWMVLGGESIRPVRLAPVVTRYPRLQVLNSYGPTECADVVAAHRLCSEDFESDVVSPPVGRPIPGSRLYVLDGDGRLALPGAAGEIYISGIGVGLGYLQQPELTAARFLPDPFHLGATMYRTGDIGRWREDGRLEYLGRNDAQVKIRGYRVELGEIESRLEACPGVRQAAVRCVDNGAEGANLVAYLVVVDDETPSTLDLRRQLASTLPEFMLPSRFVTLAALPLTPSGKVDRLALPVSVADDQDIEVYVAPQSATEQLLCDVWSELFQRARIGTTEDFFEIGGHSLLATRLLAAIARRCGVSLPIAEVFEHKTIRDQAALIARAKEKTPQDVSTIVGGSILPAEEREEVLL